MFSSFSFLTSHVEQHKLINNNKQTSNIWIVNQNLGLLNQHVPALEPGSNRHDHLNSGP